VIVTETDIGGAVPETYADDFFDYNGYGRGVGFDGALLLQVTESGDWYISTNGNGPMGGKTVFTPYAWAQAGNHVEKFLKADDPYGAYNSFLDDAATYLALTAKGEHYTVLNEWLGLFIAIAWAVALLIGFVSVSAWKAGMNTARVSGQVAAYIVPGSLQFVEKNDKLLYNTVTKTEKAVKAQSSSASGTSHISSSGRSHGGGGGKY
jgi:uncharacterized protein